MRPRLIAAVMITCTAGASVVAQSLRRTPVVQVVERVRPAVVNLTARQLVTRHRTIFDEFFPEFGPGEPSPALGSGVLISTDGLIVTNEHVIEGAAEIKVRFADGKEQEAEVIGSDADADLALLRVAGKGRPFVPVAEQDDLMIGETVIAIGNPLGLENTVTVGVLSARDRTVVSQSTQRVYTDFLQTDASINPGNSGGALVDLDGRLIGINTAIIGNAQNIGFAIPARRVRRVINDLLHYGQVQPAWLGLFVKSRGEGRRGRATLSGVVIDSVTPGSPAAQAGLTRGMPLLAGNGREFASRDDFVTMLAQVAPGDRVTLKVSDPNGERDVVLRSTRPPEDLGERILATFVGVRVGESGKRLVVREVSAESAAAEVGLEPGDVIIRVNGEPVQTLHEVNRILARDYTRSSLLLVIQRGRYAYQLPFSLSS